MTFPTWNLQLPHPKMPPVDALKQLAEQWGLSLGDGSVSPLPLDRTLNSNRPRSIDAIMADVATEQFDRLTLLEWIYCLFAKGRWDQQHPDQKDATASAIWRAAAENEGLKRRLLWRLALYYGNQQPDALPQSVAELMMSQEAVAAIGNNFLMHTLLMLLTGKQFEKLAALGLKHLLTPTELLTKLDLPHQIDAAHQAFNFTARQFCHLTKVGHAQTDWLLRCLQQMTHSQQLANIDYLLLHTPKEIINTQVSLVRWVKQHYGPIQPHSRWPELSDQAKKALRQWIGAANYADFQRLVDLTLKQFAPKDQTPDRAKGKGKPIRPLNQLEIKGVNQLGTTEINQLKSRREFWSNYSDRFARIRIFLPQSSASLLKNHFLESDVSILTEDGSDPTEICVFDFGDWYVIEFFRGRVSETRLLNRKQHPGLEEKLFHSSNLSAKCFRCLGGETFDHAYYWQVFCEKWLRERGVRPNEGLHFFRRVGTSDPYSPISGLTAPPEISQKREKYLQTWRKNLKDVEHETRSNCCKRWEAGI